MFAHDFQPDAPLTAEEASRASNLSDEQLSAIDAELLARATAHWRKVAYVVASAMQESSCSSVHLPDTFFALHVQMLVASGALESSGNLSYMRYSEVRTPLLPSAGQT